MARESSYPREPFASTICLAPDPAQIFSALIFDLEETKMQGRLDRHVARSGQRLLALSILTFAVATMTSQVRSTVAESVSSFKVVNLVGSMGTE